MAHTTLLPRQYMILDPVAVRATGRHLPFARDDRDCHQSRWRIRCSLIAAVFTPWIALGIALLLGFFASYLTALSWADLTFVLPATAFGNVIIALFARFWLHEAISWNAGRAFCSSPSVWDLSRRALPSPNGPAPEAESPLNVSLQTKERRDDDFLPLYLTAAFLLGCRGDDCRGRTGFNDR